MTRPLIIFDLDGTIADTAPDLVGTLNRICMPHGLAKVEISQIGQLVGQGAKAMIARTFELNEKPMDETLADSLFNDFLEDYSANLTRETKLFEGFSSILEALKSQSYPMAVCTNKREAHAVKLVKELRIDAYFDAITGGDSFTFRKPDARHLTETARLANQPLEKAIMVGDSINDIKAAQNANIASIAVTFGYSDLPVTELGATEVISAYDQFHAALERIETPL